eukprot:XP_020407378.1 predicted GPI-anchored protein 58 [Zea mays]
MWSLGTVGAEAQDNDLQAAQQARHRGQCLATSTTFSSNMCPRSTAATAAVTPPPPPGTTAQAQLVPDDLPSRPDAQPEHDATEATPTQPDATGAAPTQPAAAGASAPVPDATGARPDPAGARFTGSSSGKVPCMRPPASDVVVVVVFFFFNSGGRFFLAACMPVVCC